MEKLLRILFVMSAIAFVTTLTACADDKDDKTAKTPSIFKFEAAPKGVTIDESKDVYKITINPSLLTYAAVTDAAAAATHHNGNFAIAPAPIFTVTFKDDKLQGFIIPTTVDKADALTTTHVADLDAAITADKVVGKVTAEGLFLGAPNNVTRSFLADADADDPVFGFSATELNAAWSTLAPRVEVIDVAAAGGNPQILAQDEFPGIPNIESDTKVRVMCATTITGITALSFATAEIVAPDTDDKPIAIGTETVCSFSLVSDGADDAAKKTARKAWATEVVKLAKDDATKNIQKMGFVGIVTGDATASAITNAAGITADDDTLGVKGFTADASAKLVKAYTTSFQKVEIVIAVAK